MSEAILLATAAIDAGIALGWGACALQRWLHDGRRMVLSFCNALAP